MKRWRCTICGYVHDGDKPPFQCPICRAPAAMFEEIESPSPDSTETGHSPNV